jgi:hypothetical protein
LEVIWGFLLGWLIITSANFYDQRAPVLITNKFGFSGIAVVDNTTETPNEPYIFRARFLDYLGGKQWIIED